MTIRISAATVPLAVEAQPACLSQVIRYSFF